MPCNPGEISKLRPLTHLSDDILALEALVTELKTSPSRKRQTSSSTSTSADDRNKRSRKLVSSLKVSGESPLSFAQVNQKYVPSLVSSSSVQTTKAIKKKVSGGYRKSSVRWTDEEVQALNEGVLEFVPGSYGSWPKIREKYDSVFAKCRTSACLSKKYNYMENIRQMAQMAADKLAEEHKRRVYSSSSTRANLGNLMNLHGLKFGEDEMGSSSSGGSNF